MLQYQSKMVREGGGAGGAFYATVPEKDGEEGVPERKAL